MRKHKRRGEGFGSTSKIQSSKNQPSNNTFDHNAKEKEALALISEGKLNDAEFIYREIVAAGSQSHLVYGNLGALLKIKGDISNAIKCFKKALQINKDYPEAHNNLAIAFMAQGDSNAAIASYKTALKLNPNYPDAHNNLGNTLRDKGDLTAAIASYKTALKLNPNYPDAHNNLGNALRDEGDSTAAIACYKNALQLNPNYPDAYINLGNALRDEGDLTAAIACYKNALQLNPNYPDAYINLGNALKDKGDLDNALLNHKRALKLNPKSSYAFYGISLIQAAKGNLKGSKNSLHTAIELDSRNTAALYELSANIENKEDSINLLKKLDNITKKGLTKNQELMLEFALAHLHHSLQEYAKAAEHIANSNKIKLKLHPSDLSNQLLLTKQTTILSSQAPTGNPNDGEGRIFIVGAPRCGSTLLESVLTTNSNIRDLGETQALSKAFSQINDIISPKNGGNHSLSLAYTESTKEPLKDYTHSVDKNLYNFRMTEAIALAMPAAKIIHCRRHPLDNILSMLRSNLSAGNNYTSSPLDAAKFLIHQEEEMRKYRNKYASHIFTFDYDTFTSNPREALPPLIDWLGFKFKETYLHPEASNRLINTASFRQARKPISNKSVGGWKNYRDLLKPASDILLESGLFYV